VNLAVPEGESEQSSVDLSRPSTVTLVLIPLLIVCIWIIENYLLHRKVRSYPEKRLFWDFSCIRSFPASLSGSSCRSSVSARHSGQGRSTCSRSAFRTLRRTVAAVSLTALAVYTLVLFLRIYGTGPDRDTGFFLAGLLLPTAIAAVMICWGLLGTHIQAYVRSGGILVSVIIGVVVTALVFALSMTLLLASGRIAEAFPGYFAAGIAAALFFFAVRDIYATVVAVTGALVVLAGSAPGFSYPYSLVPAAAVCAFLTLAVLVAAHGHFSRHYTTVKLPKKQ